MPARRQSSKDSKPRSGSHLSDSEIMRILTLAHTSLSNRAIANKVGRSQSSVSRMLCVYDYETFCHHDSTRIRKQKTTKYEDRILIRTTKTHDDQAFRDIIHISGIKVSETTLGRRLKEVKLYSRIRRHKPVLTNHHKAACLHWARKYQHWMVNDWM